MRSEKIRTCSDQAIGESQSRSFVVMLSKVLLFAISDLEELRMRNCSLRLHQVINELMLKYNLEAEDINMHQGENLH
jgi:hypothetical protein